MGMHKFWSIALPFGKVACVVKGIADYIVDTAKKYALLL